MTRTWMLWPPLVALTVAWCWFVTVYGSGLSWDWWPG